MVFTCVWNYNEWFVKKKFPISSLVNFLIVVVYYITIIIIPVIAVYSVIYFPIQAIAAVVVGWLVYKIYGYL